MSQESKRKNAAAIAGDWWSERLPERYADKRAAFSAAVAARVFAALRGDIAWKWEPCTFPGGVTGSHTVRCVGDGKPLSHLKLEFDYDPDALLEEAIIEAVDPGIKSWDLKQLLPTKHRLLIDLEKSVIKPKEGYGHWTADIPISENA